MLVRNVGLLNEYPTVVDVMGWTLIVGGTIMVDSVCYFFIVTKSDLVHELPISYAGGVRSV